jgi:Putative adhesin
MSYRAAAVTAAAVAAGLAVAGCRFEINIGSRSIADDARVNGPLSAVQLAAGDGDIRIHTGPGAGAAIHRTIRYRGATKPQPSQQVTNGVLTFVKGCANCSIDYDLTVPASVQVRIRNGSGSIRVVDVAAADIRAGSGDVTVRNVPGAVRAHTGSGSVRVDSVGAQNDLHTSSGDIRATALGGGMLLADTGSGSILLRFGAAPSNVRAVTGSGDLRINLPSGRYKVDSSTGSGDSDVNVPDDPAATATVFAKTGSGSILIDPTD